MGITTSSPVLVLLGLWFGALGLLGVALVRDHRGWLTRMVDRRAAMGLLWRRDAERDRREQRIAAAVMAAVGLGVATLSTVELLLRAVR